MSIYNKSKFWTFVTLFLMAVYGIVIKTCSADESFRNWNVAFHTGAFTEKKVWKERGNISKTVLNDFYATINNVYLI